MSDANRQLIEKVNAAFEQNKLEDFYSLCHEDVEWQMAGEKTRKGLDAIREFMSHVPSDCAFPKINVTAIISDGDRAACYGDMTMMEKGAESAYDYCDIYKFDGDKIARLTSFVLKQGGEPSHTESTAA